MSMTPVYRPNLEKKKLQAAMAMAMVPVQNYQKRPPSVNVDDTSSTSDRKKKKKSRWGMDDQKTVIPGMPTMLPPGLDPTKERCYLVQLQIEEISRKLRTGEFGIPPNPEDRSPSPEPIYNNEGKRMNTRDFRTRKKLEEQRHELIKKLQADNPEYKPPGDYKPPAIRVDDKVWIPQDDHPEINFVGMLIGPRGNTLKNLEKETGAKVIIRGKGSVKEGRVGIRANGQPLPGEDEPLHAYITASNTECVKKAVAKIKEVIRLSIEVPEGENNLRRNQLRELALLNGTLREADNAFRCNNCGATSHRSWQCTEKLNVTSNIVCTQCGGAGHISQDCKLRRPGDMRGGGPPGAFGGPGMPPQTAPGNDRAKIDEEYQSLMAELGEGPPPPPKSGPPPAPRFQPGQARPLMATNLRPPPQALNNPQQALAPPWARMTPARFPPPPPGGQQNNNMLPPPPASTANNSAPPWQQAFAAVAAAAAAANNAPPASMQQGPPPSLFSQPPPPPPSTSQQGSVVPPPGFPWQQQQQRPPAAPPQLPTHNSGGTNNASWQTGSNMAANNNNNQQQQPWQQNMQQQQQQQPPPGMWQQFNRPPPPPPGGAPDISSLLAAVAAPPPPPE